MRHAIANFLIVIVCVAFLVPLLLSWWTTPGSSSLQHHGIDQLLELSRQLEDANRLNRNYKSELSSLKQELEVFVVMQGGIDHSPTKSAVVSFLPHLADHLDALVPANYLSVGKRKDVSFVIGVTTTKRADNHLIETLKSVVSSLSTRDTTDALIVVMVGESDDSYVKSVIADVKNNFGSAVSSGLIEVVSPKAYYYPDLTRLKPTLGDTPERTQWRTKQVLDFCYLMMFCRTRANYFLQIPDDVTTKENYLDEIRQFILEQHSNEWLVLDFAPETPGIIGKLFRSMDLNAFSEFFLMFHRDKPADWLFEDFLSVKYCNPEKSQDDCAHEKDAARRKYHRALFTQIGTTSAPQSSNNNNKDKKRPRLFIPHENPPASVSTTLNQYQDFRIDLAYAGENHFWALMPAVNDTVTFELTPPVKLKQFYFRSGNADHIDDRFYDTVVEIKFNEPISKDKLTGPEFKDYKVIPSYDFVIAGAFDGNGIAEGNIPTFAPVSILRLRCTKESTFWVALSEIKLTSAT